MSDSGALNVGDVEAVLRLQDEFSDVASKFMDSLSEVIPGLDGLAVGVGVFTAAVAAGVAVIAELGSHGSEVNDVSDGFQRLAGSADNANAILDQMRTGVAGTVSDFNLMKDATQMMAAGVQLTAGNYGTLTDAARVLSHEGFGPTKDILDQLTQSMITGRTRTLEHMTGVIDITGAQQSYSEALDTGGGKLDKVAQAEANRQAILERLNAVVAQAGDQELTFGEKMDRAKATLDNLWNAIAVGVATSPAVNAAMDAIGSAIQNAFGGNQVSLVDTIIGYVNQFAIFVVDLGIAMTSFATVGVTVWGVVKTAILAVEYVLVEMAAQFGEAINGALQFAARVPGATQSVKDLAASSQSLADGLRQTSDGLKGETADAAAMVTGHSTLNTAIDKVGGTLMNLRDTMVQASAAGTDHNKILNEMAPRHQEGAAAASAHQKAVQQLLDTWTGGGKTLQVTIDAFNLLTTAQLADVNVQAQLIPAIEKLVAAHQTIPPAMIAEYNAALQARTAREADDLQMLMSTQGVEAHILALQRAGYSQTEIATTLGVSTAALKSYQTIWTETSKVIDGLSGITLPNVAATLNATVKAWDSNIAAAQSYSAKLFDITTTGTDKQIGDINRERDAALEAIKIKSDGDDTYYQDAAAAAKAYYDHLTDVANGTADTIEERMRAQGIHTQDDLDQAAANAERDYQQMLDSGEYSAAQLQIAWKKMTDANIAAGNDWLDAFEADIDQVGASLVNAFATGGSFGQAALSGAQKLGDDISTNLLRPVEDSLASAGHGALASALGDMAGPLGGAVVSLGVSLGEKLWGSLFGTAGRDAVVNFANTFQGGFDGLHQQLDQLGAQGEQLWISLTQGVGRNDPAAAQKAIQNVTDALNTLHSAESSQILSLANQITSLGGQISPALDPYIQKLQQMGVLTQANADQLKGMEGDGTPTYATLTALQQKYNLTAAEMGPAFQTQQINDQFQSLINDLDTLTKGGVDMQSAMFTAGTNGAQALTGLGTSIQTDIQQAINAGVAIPENLKSAAQALINQGDLLDASGQKITDINSMTFGETMQDSLDTLNTTLQTLIQTMTGDGPNSLTSALDTIGSKTVSPHITPIIDAPNVPGGYSVGTGGDAVFGGAQAGGGDYMVSQPTWFLAGEAGPERATFSGAGNTGGSGGGTYTTVIQLDGREIARSVANRLPDELIRAGIGGGY